MMPLTVLTSVDVIADDAGALDRLFVGERLVTRLLDKGGAAAAGVGHRDGAAGSVVGDEETRVVAVACIELQVQGLSDNSRDKRVRTDTSGSYRSASRRSESRCRRSASYRRRPPSVCRR